MSPNPIALGELHEFNISSQSHLNRSGCSAAMTLEQLRIFLAVAEHLHFTRAAEHLEITQPAVSAAVKSLEAEYGVNLFHRIGRRIEITPAGNLLQVEAQKILEQVTLTERGLRELNNLQHGELKIGSSLTIGNYWLPEKISQFKQAYPNISVHCTLANAQEIYEGTATGLFDLGLATGDIKPALKIVLEQSVVGQEYLLIVVGQDHAWFKRRRISVLELTETRWVMRESGSGPQQIFEQTLQTWGIDLAQLQIGLILSSSEMVKAVVEGGTGAAAIPELMVKKELALGTLRSIQITKSRKGAGKPLEIVQPVWKVKHRQRFQTQIAIAFEQMLHG